MFTGLVEGMAEVLAVEIRPPGRRIALQAPEIASDAKIGDSIAVNGCCLTVIELGEGRMQFDAGPETLERTNLGHLAIGGRANLERSLSVGDRLGGHFVTGHIDGLGTLEQRQDLGDWSNFRFSAPATLLRQMAAKGSIAIDGVSLTLVHVDSQGFSVQLIPHTLAVTTLGTLRDGDTVNLETDLMAKYVEQQLNYRGSTTTA